MSLLTALGLVLAALPARAYEVTLKTDESQMTNWEKTELKKWRRVKGHQYKKHHVDGYCNCIFSNEPTAGKADKDIKVVEQFATTDKVYARCYFPGALTTTKDNFRVMIAVNGRQVNFLPDVDPPKGKRVMDLDVTALFKDEMPSPGREYEIMLDIWAKGKAYRKERILHLRGGNDSYTTTRTHHSSSKLAKSMFKWGAAAPKMTPEEAREKKMERLQKKGQPGGKCPKGEVWWSGRCRPL